MKHCLKIVLLLFCAMPSYGADKDAAAALVIAAASTRSLDGQPSRGTVARARKTARARREARDHQERERERELQQARAGSAPSRGSSLLDVFRRDASGDSSAQKKGHRRRTSSDSDIGRAIGLAEDAGAEAIAAAFEEHLAHKDDTKGLQLFNRYVRAQLKEQQQRQAAERRRRRASSRRGPGAETLVRAVVAATAVSQSPDSGAGAAAPDDEVAGALDLEAAAAAAAAIPPPVAEGFDTGGLPPLPPPPFDGE